MLVYWLLGGSLMHCKSVESIMPHVEKDVMSGTISDPEKGHREAFGRIRRWFAGFASLSFARMNNMHDGLRRTSVPEMYLQPGVSSRHLFGLVFVLIARTTRRSLCWKARI